MVLLLFREVSRSAAQVRGLRGGRGGPGVVRLLRVRGQVPGAERAHAAHASSQQGAPLLLQALRAQLQTGTGPSRVAPPSPTWFANQSGWLQIRRPIRTKFETTRPIGKHLVLQSAFESMIRGLVLIWTQAQKKKPQMRSVHSAL
jgi:hypothetical protein